MHGLYPPLVTPFDADDRVDLSALEGLAAGLIDAGAAGLVALGSTAEPFALLEIAAIDGVAGIKQSGGAIDEDVVRFMAERPPDFAVLCGDDALIQPLLALGGAGAIAASAHFATERFARLVRDAELADAEGLLPLVRALFAEPNPAVLKGLLHRQGRIATPDVRMPMLPAGPGAVDSAAAALAELDTLSSPR